MLLDLLSLSAVLLPPCAPAAERLGERYTLGQRLYPMAGSFDRRANELDLLLANLAIRGAVGFPEDLLSDREVPQLLCIEVRPTSLQVELPQWVTTRLNRRQSHARSATGLHRGWSVPGDSVSVSSPGWADTSRPQLPGAVSGRGLSLAGSGGVFIGFGHRTVGLDVAGFGIAADLWGDSLAGLFSAYPGHPKCQSGRAGIHLGRSRMSFDGASGRCDRCGRGVGRLEGRRVGGP